MFNHQHSNFLPSLYINPSMPGLSMGQLAHDIYQTATKKNYNFYGLLKAVWSAKGYARQTKNGKKNRSTSFFMLEFPSLEEGKPIFKWQIYINLQWETIPFQKTSSLINQFGKLLQAEDFPGHSLMSSCLPGSASFVVSLARRYCGGAEGRDDSQGGRSFFPRKVSELESKSMKCFTGWGEYEVINILFININENL